MFVLWFTDRFITLLYTLTNFLLFQLFGHSNLFTSFCGLRFLFTDYPFTLAPLALTPLTLRHDD